MKRFFSLLSILALMALIGCEQQENPNAPVENNALQKSPSGQQPNELHKLSSISFKFNSDETKAKLDEAIAQAQGMVNQYKAQHPAKQASPNSLAKHNIIEVPDDYPTIQEAVDNALPGDEIVVEKGTYDGYITIATPNLEVKGEDDELVKINGPILVAADGVELEHFDIDPAGFFLGVIVLGSSKVEIHGNTIASSGSFVGILMLGGNNCTVKENKVSDNLLGLVLIASNDNTLNANRFRGNFAGIVLLGIIGPSVDNNKIANNVCDDNFEAGIALINAANNKLSGNSCNRNNAGVGIFLAFATQNTIGPNNTANGNGALGLWLTSGADNNAVIKNTFRNNTDLDIVNEGLGNKFKNNKAKNTFGV